MKINKYASVSLIVLMQLIAPQALAQSVVTKDGADVATSQTTVEPDQDQPSDESNSLQLSEIVVTAQKRSESLQKVPIAVDVVSGENLTRSGAFSTLDLTLRSPSFQPANSVGNILLRLRGVGTSIAGAGLEPAVGIYVDGVYIADGAAAAIQFNSIERVEILKGPQGTLFGRNATGGVINIVTREPSQDTSGEFAIGYGNYDTVRGSMYATTGIAENLAVDFALRGTFQGRGYGKNLFTGRDNYRTESDYSIRSKLKWTPTDRTAITVSGDYSSAKGTINPVRPYPGTLSIIPLPQPDSPYDYNADANVGDKFSSKGLMARMEQDVLGAKLVSISGYRKSLIELTLDQDLTSVDALVVNYLVRTRSISQEFQLLSQRSGPIQFVAGLYYFNNYAHAPTQDFIISPPLQAAFGGLGAILIDSEIRTKSYAAYGQVTAEIAEGSKLTGGIRYTTDKSKLNGTQTGVLPDGTSLGDLLPPGTVPKSAEFSKLTWRVAFDQEIGENVLGYASVSSGFKSGGFAPGQLADPAYKPETLISYEVGIKSELLDRRLRLNASAFYYDYKDVQVSQYVNGFNSIVNGAKAQIYGLDVDSELVLGRFRVTNNISILNTEYKSFPNAPFATPSPSGGNIITTSDARGNELPFSSKFAASTGVEYTIPLGSGDLTASGTWLYNDGFFAQEDNQIRQSSFSQFNANLVWERSDGSFSIGLWGKNLSNEIVISAAQATAFGTFTTYQAPRTYGATVSFRF